LHKKTTKGKEIMMMLSAVLIEGLTGQAPAAPAPTTSSVWPTI